MDMKETKPDEKKITLGELFDIRSGAMLNRIVSEENTETCRVRVLSATNKSSVKTIKNSYKDRIINQHALKEGDLVLSLVYPYQCIYITEEYLKGCENTSEGCICCITSHFHVVLRPKSKDEFDAHYYHAVLCKLGINGELANCRRHDSCTAIISLQKFKTLTVPVPDIEKQKEKGKIFQEFQKRIQLLQKLIDAEKELIDAEKRIVDCWLTGTSNTDNVKNIIKLHKEWKKESIEISKEISNSWDSFLNDVINSTR